MTIRRIVLITGLLLLPPIAATIAQTAKITWPDAIAELAKWKTQALGCADALKQYGKQEDVERGRRAYRQAKAESDGVIAGLVTALSEGGNPPSLSDLQGRLQNGVSALNDFCKIANEVAPPASGERGFLTELLKAGLEQAIKPLSAAVAALYNDYINAKQLTRDTIRAQLEAAKWPEFS